MLCRLVSGHQETSFISHVPPTVQAWRRWTGSTGDAAVRAPGTLKQRFYWCI